MARFDRLTVLNTMVDLGLVPVFYNGDAEVAKKIAAACAAGGCNLVEFTNRGDFAPQVFLELAQHFAKADPNLILGVGSVVDAPTAALYISYGASFVVGPILNREVARLCNRRKIAYSPGCGTASEVARAEELGVEIVKIFPGNAVGGPGFVKAVRGPCPWTRIMPTGGVDATEESITSWFDAGVACVGMGSKLITKDLVAAGDFNGISQKVAAVLNWIRKARGQQVFTGVEHVGLYPTDDATSKEIAEWYGERFGFMVREGNSSFFATGTGPGRIEVMKAKEAYPCHVAIRVADFEAAVETLRAQGVELVEPKLKPDVRAIFLKETDPAGNKVHILWRACGGMRRSQAGA